jgi:hypothetical protein
VTRAGRTGVQWVCLALGIVLVARAATVLASGTDFDVPGDGFHALFHLASGLGLLAAQARTNWAAGALLAFGTAYAVLTVGGLVDGENALGVFPVDATANAVHAGYAVLALAAGAAGAIRGGPRSRPEVTG